MAHRDLSIFGTPLVGEQPSSISSAIRGGECFFWQIRFYSSREENVFGAVPGVAGAFIMVESRIEEASVQETEAGSHPYCCPVRGLVSCQIL